MSRDGMRVTNSHDAYADLSLDDRLRGESEGAYRESRGDTGGWPAPGAWPSHPIAEPCPHDDVFDEALNGVPMPVCRRCGVRVEEGSP